MIIQTIIEQLPLLRNIIEWELGHPDSTLASSQVFLGRQWSRQKK